MSTLAFGLEIFLFSERTRGNFLKVRMILKFQSSAEFFSKFKLNGCSRVFGPKDCVAKPEHRTLKRSSPRTKASTSSGSLVPMRRTNSKHD